MFRIKCIGLEIFSMVMICMMMFGVLHSTVSTFATISKEDAASIFGVNSPKSETAELLRNMGECVYYVSS